MLRKMGTLRNDPPYPDTSILFERGKKKDGISICRTSYRSDPTIDITKTEYSIA